MFSISAPDLPVPHAATPFDVVVIAASLGGMQALSEVLSALPASFPAAIIIVQHLSPDYKSYLVEILQKRTPLFVEWADMGTSIRAGHVYVAPPNFHVLIKTLGILTLTQTPKVQFTRPSANPLFESVAACYRERAIAVVLTGAGDDGAGGIRAIKEAGGRTFVQNRHTARAFSMPQAALKTGCVDFALSLNAIAPALVAFTMVRGAAQLFTGI
jgi:two-component system chemotaxis response regulator CheB